MRGLLVGLAVVAESLCPFDALAAQDERAIDAPREDVAVERAMDEPEEDTAESEGENVEFSFAVLGAFGVAEQSRDSPLNPYGAGFGARVGTTLAGAPLYLGLSFIRFVGEKEGDVEESTTTLDAEVGYDVRFYEGMLVIRPQVSVGFAQTVTLTPHERGYPVGFHFAPGLVADLRVRPLSISLGLRRDTLTDEWADAVSFMVGVGAAL